MQENGLGVISAVDFTAGLGRIIKLSAGWMEGYVAELCTPCCVAQCRWWWA